LDGRSDKNLVVACRTGDRKAYAILVKKYYRQVFLTCMGILGNVHDAEDIAQDAMLKGFLEIKKLRDDSQFCPWIVRIAKNMCINMAQRKKYIRKVLEEKAMQPNRTETRNDNLEQAMEKLPEDVRLPLVMYYFDGQSVKTVAERLNISTPGVYLKLRTATKQLHELLVKQGDVK
jgi:RNA polymerase sigma factor (sigma-70 family)